MSPSGLSWGCPGSARICPRPAGAARTVSKASSDLALSPGLHVQVCVEMLQIHEVRELGRGEERLQDATEGQPGGGSSLSLATPCVPKGRSLSLPGLRFLPL